MIRLDPLTQTVTASLAATSPRAAQVSAPAQAAAPAEGGDHFVAAIGRATSPVAHEAGYAALRVRRRMTGQMSGLSDLDMRLSGAAAGLRGIGATPPESDAQDQQAAAKEASLAELRGAVAALNVAISGARSDVAGMLRQMQADLVATMAVMDRGDKAPQSADAALAGASDSGETLIRQATALSARAARS